MNKQQREWVREAARKERSAETKQLIIIFGGLIASLIAIAAIHASVGGY